MIAPVDITGVRLETDRLILRPWTKADLEDFYEYARVDGVGQMAGWQPHENREVSLQILQMFIAERKTFAIILKENGKAIGSLGLEEHDELPAEYDTLSGREIGYVLSKDYWGRGLMPEAVTAAIRYCFETLGMDYLTCGHFDFNNQSRRVIEKCGFRYLQNFDFSTRMGTVQHGKLYILQNPNK